MRWIIVVLILLKSPIHHFWREWILIVTQYFKSPILIRFCLVSRKLFRGTSYLDRGEQTFSCKQRWIELYLWGKWTLRITFTFLLNWTTRSFYSDVAFFENTEIHILLIKWSEKLWWDSNSTEESIWLYNYKKALE